MAGHKPFARGFVREVIFAKIDLFIFGGVIEMWFLITAHASGIGVVEDPLVVL